MSSSSRKSTFPLFESICLLDGKIQHRHYHIERFQKVYNTYFGQASPYDLFEGIPVPQDYQTGKVKLRISYGINRKKFTFSHYQKSVVKQLKLVVDDTITYDLKFEDRTALDTLCQQRGDCDDVLIIKKGLVTDTSYANIVFFDGLQWCTPSTFLLNGTCRKRLLESGLIQERKIQLDEIYAFQGFQLVNALLGFDPDWVVPISGIQG